MVKKAIFERLSFSIKFYTVFRVISMELGISISIIYVQFRKSFFFFILTKSTRLFQKDL